MANVVPIRPAGPAHHPGAFPKYAGPAKYGRNYNEIIPPEELHKHLDVAPFARFVKFTNEKHLMRYRALLYRVNVEGKFRYATRREGWSSLIILRLK